MHAYSVSMLYFTESMINACHLYTIQSDLPTVGTFVPVVFVQFAEVSMVWGRHISVQRMYGCSNERQISIFVPLLPLTVLI